jgi:hypothetical protein
VAGGGTTAKMESEDLIKLKDIASQAGGRGGG